MTDYTVNFEYNFENCTLVDTEIEMYEVNDIMQYIDEGIDLVDVLNIQVFSHELGYDVFVELVDSVIEYRVARETNAWYMIREVKRKHENVRRVV